MLLSIVGESNRFKALNRHMRKTLPAVLVTFANAGGLKKIHKHIKFRAHRLVCDMIMRL